MVGLRGKPGAVLATVVVGVFMAIVDVSIVNVAIPDIIADLDASLAESLWVINSYALVGAALVITTGRLGDLIGLRRMFAAGVVVFTASSLLCGLASGPDVLIAARVAQGLGATMFVPQTLALVTRTFPADRRGVAFAVWSAVVGLGFIAGPLLGGILVNAGGWRWIFLVNVPVGIVLLALTAVTLPGGRANGRFRLDLPSVVLASVSLLCVCYGLVEGERYDWGRIVGPLSIPVVIAAGVVAFAAFLWRQRRGQDRDPLVPFQLFADRNFGLMGLVLATGMFALVGTMVPIMLYLQEVLGLSAVAAGLALLPQAAISALAALLVGRFADRPGARWLVVVGLVCAAAGVAWVGWSAEPDGPWASILPGMILVGLGVGVAQVPVNTIAMRRVPEHLAGAASAVFNTMRQLGTTIGIAAVGALLQSQLVATISAHAGERAGALPAEAREPFVGYMRDLATGGLERGAGADIPAVPGASGQQVAGVADAVVRHGFVEAFGHTMVLPSVLLLVATLAGLAVRRHPGHAADPASATTG